MLPAMGGLALITAYELRRQLLEEKRWRWTFGVPVTLGFVAVVGLSVYRVYEGDPMTRVTLWLPMLVVGEPALHAEVFGPGCTIHL